MTEIKFTDESRNHYTRLQNILSYIGLNAFQRSVYWAIRECAGEKRNCTKSYAKLAEMAGMSVPSLHRHIATLCEINSFIKKPLIKVVYRKTEYGDKDTNEIICLDLWQENGAYFKNINGPITEIGPPITEIEGTITQTGGVLSHRQDGPITVIDNQYVSNNRSFNKNQSINQVAKKGEWERGAIDDGLIDSFHICRNIYLKQSELDECIKYHGSLEKVKEQIEQILDSPKRKHEISDWVNAILSWKFKDKIVDNSKKNEILGKNLEAQYKNPTNTWTLKVYRHKIKDFYGVLFEVKSGEEPPFIVGFCDGDFENKVMNAIKERKMKKGGK